MSTRRLDTDRGQACTLGRGLPSPALDSTNPGPMETLNGHEERIRALAHERSRARDEAARVDEDLRVAVIEAYEAGYPKARIMEWSGLARRTLYVWLGLNHWPSAKQS